MASVVSSDVSNNISVDCVIFGFDFERLNVLLVERTLLDDHDGHVIFSDHTLTGNHVYIDETLDTAAHRIPADLTGLDNIYLEQFKTFGSPDRLKRQNDQLWLKSCGRDPNNRVVTVGCVALLAQRDIRLVWKGRNVKWYALDSLPDLAFDHNLILEEALKYIRYKLLHEPSIGFELLPPKFTLTQLQTVYEVILGCKLDKRNFRKKTSRMEYLVALEEKQTGVAHKPAQLYKFDKEIYDSTRKDIISFYI